VYFWSTLLGALAVLASTVAIPPMVSGGSWVWPTVEVVAVIWLVGLGARLARLPPGVILLVQIAAAAVALTALFTTGGFGGVIPNGAVLSEANELFDAAWDQIRTSVSPASSSTELAFLISVSVGIIALIVDVLIALCRAPALVALPLLCMYSVPASIDVALLPWEAFAAPAMLYALLLVVAGLTGRRTDTGAATAQVVSGVGLAALAVVAAVLVASWVTGIGTAGRLPRGGTSAASGIGLSPFASLQGNLQRSDPVPMLRVSGLAHPDYLRTIGLQKWTPGEGWSVDSLADGALPTKPLPAPGVALPRRVTVTSLAYRDQFLPIYRGTTSIAGLEPGWSYDAALESVHRADAVKPEPYELSVSAADVTADDLRADTVSTGGLLTETGQLADEVTALTAKVTAGATTAFDKADALRSFFTNPANGFTYSLDVPKGDSGDALVDFLRNRKGFCEQYASAMAIMLRAAGVPARVAIGFTQGTPDGNGSYVISSNDAHAWVEVLFTGAGWVRFDPTPLAGGQGGEQGFTDAEATPTSAPPTTSRQTSAGPPTSGGLRPDTGEAGGPTAGLDPAAGGAPATAPAVSSTLWWLLAVFALLAGAGAGPTVVRIRRRRRRQTVAQAGGSGAAAAVWGEIEDLAVDYGIGLNSAESARATANRLAKAAHLGEKDRALLRSVVIRAEQGWYAAARSAEPTASAGGEAGSASGTPVDTTSADPTSADPAAVTGPAARGGAVRVDERPADVIGLWPAATVMAESLERSAPLSPIERLVPRSVRPAWWRD
jgi:transglutaminase-like putative cysteine protease